MADAAYTTNSSTKSRRGFLRGLAALPLIGGGVTLIGAPTAVAEPVTPELVEAYKTWLDMELRHLYWEMADDPFYKARYAHVPGGDSECRRTRSLAINSLLSFQGDSGSFHMRSNAQEASARAALVLSAVGCDWRDKD